jgi:hypothetical protein
VQSIYFWFTVVRYPITDKTATVAIKLSEKTTNVRQNYCPAFAGLLYSCADMINVQ